ncbi:thioredoxin domain-containing protein [Bacteriovorax sp. PP10]|uniref:Thioredoxin domain-containing protein n=1 Tax=Bacteriovorax antarcticus TaxID=3088717 RepID=A0ABU5VV06_9BACT|nr:thioredoxin domain-containing protein [Bacteriovorax sp. PP10]MEA9356872.1 thioredoxin domain-containing protein [Bacteriovorax sp. PP10]
MTKKSVYLESSMNTTIAIFVLSALMIGFSIYLTGHYFELKFPTGLESGSLCNLNSFFNCDKTTLSAASNIAGVPISIFGILIGALTMIGMFVKNENYEKTIYYILIINLVGCVLLFFYSLFGLGGLCPFCTLYYITSALTLWLFYKKSPSYSPNPAILVIFAVIFLAVGFLVKMNVNKKIENMTAVSNDLINQYYGLPNLGAPKVVSEFKIATAENAPIKMQIFSDFECPACRALSEMMPQILLRYGGKIDIQYFFYPLDSACNPSMERGMHQSACKAAYYAVCKPVADFGVVHDEIFHNQDRIADFIAEKIKSDKLEACVADPKTKEKVQSIIAAATPFNIRSTPSFLLNGVKIEGVLPSDQLFAIMDEILKRSQK